MGRKKIFEGGGQRRGEEFGTCGKRRDDIVIKKRPENQEPFFAKVGAYWRQGCSWAH